MKIISICIPTYNRAKALDRLLQKINDEIKNIENFVEVCISDNGSTDDTQQIIQKWINILPLTFQKNDKNLGYDRNVIKVTKLAKGKYVWYMGDDDTIIDGSLAKLVKDLEPVEEVGAVYVNYYHNYQKTWRIPFEFNGFKYFKKNELSFPIDLGFCGAICIKRDLVFEVIDRYIEERDEKLYKKNLGDVVFHDFIHTYLFLECLVRSPNVGIVSNYGICVIEDGQPKTYKRKMYFDLLTMGYVLEMRKYYSWFNDLFKGKYRFITYLSRLGMASEYSDLEEIHVEAYKCLKVLWRLDKKPLASLIVDLIESTRFLPFAKKFWSRMHKFVRSKFGMNIVYQIDSNPILNKNITYIIEKSKILRAKFSS